MNTKHYQLSINIGNKLTKLIEYINSAHFKTYSIIKKS